MNYRLQARRTAQTKVSSSEPTSGSEERALIYKDLDGVQKAIVNKEVFETQSLIDTMMAFRCHVPGNAFRVAIENDMAPRLVAESIIPLRGANDDEILLPYLPIASFYKTHPNFFSTYVSSARYIEYRGDDRKDWKRGSYTNTINDKDIFETYAQLLNGTLTNFFKNPTDDNAMMVWRASRTVEAFSEILMKKMLSQVRKDFKNGILPKSLDKQLSQLLPTPDASKEGKDKEKKEKAPVEGIPVLTKVNVSPFSDLDIKVLDIYIQHMVEKHYAEVVELIKNRDKSFDDAKRFKNETGALPPVVFYSIAFQAMLLDQEVLHKSNFIQTDLLLSGLILTKYLPEGVKISGIEDSFLRILYERGSNSIRPNVLAEIVEKDKLIAVLHENVGSGFHYFLKQNAFATEVYRQLLLFPSSNWYYTRFKKILFAIFSHINSESGITLYSHRIAPSASQYITDEVVAEFIASICKVSKASLKHTSLQTAMFNSSNEGTSVLHRVLRHNVDILEKFMKETSGILESLSEKAESGKVVDLLYGYRHPRAHIGSTDLSRRFKKLLVAFIQQDSELAPLALSNLIRDILKSKAVILGAKKIVGGIVYHSKPNGNVHKWLVQAFPERSKYPGKNLFHGMRNVQLSTQYTLDELSYKKEEFAKENESVPHFTFVPFESIQALQSKNKYLHDLDVIFESECPICMEENVSLFSLHGDVRHSICYSCKAVITETCPFCREPLNTWIYK